MSYIFGVSLPNQNQNLFYKSDIAFSLYSLVVVTSPRGLEIGKILTLPKEIDDDSSFESIERLADDDDLMIFKRNKEDCALIFKEVQSITDENDLGMRIASCEYTLDRSKLIISYFAENRVDFRDLLKILASKYRCRIDLRQIGARDKAKMVGGLGSCGLALCCSTFLNTFDGITIHMAKNQMLTLNIPKLSGQCGKLMCCLNFENDIYTEERKNFPKVGSKIKHNDNIYKIVSFNILTKIIRLESKDNVIFLPLDQVKNELITGDNEHETI